MSRALRAASAAGDEARKGPIRQANEALILGAGERIFARTGFNGATMAAIADEAGLPKANLHYYFGNKLELYRAVLARTLHDWLVPLDGLRADADPAEALARYIRAKMAMSAVRPDASRVFAKELLLGAAVVGDLMRGEHRVRRRRFCFFSCQTHRVAHAGLLRTFAGTCIYREGTGREHEGPRPAGGWGSRSPDGCSCE